MANHEQYLKEALSKYKHPDICKRDILQAFQNYKDLSPTVDTFVFNDGNRKELLCLVGTILVNYKGGSYNIPVCIWMTDTHPYNPPMVYVKPTPDMQIKIGPNTDDSGKVYLPYLHEWNHAKCNLVGLIQVLSIIWSDNPPVFSRAKAAVPPRPSYGPGHNPATPPYPGTASPHKQQAPYPSGPPQSQTTTTTPYPPSQPGGTSSAPYPTSGYAGMPMPVVNTPQYTGYPPQTSGYTPPTTASSHGSYSTGSGYTPSSYPSQGYGAQGYPSQGYHQPSSNPPYPTPQGSTPYPSVAKTGVATTSATPSETQNQSSLSDDQIRMSVLSAVEDKMKRRLKEIFAQAQAEMDVLKKTQDDLKMGKTKLDEMLSTLQREQNEVDKNIAILQEKDEEIRTAIGKLESQGEVNIDEAIMTTTPLYRQILNAFAEEQAIEDAIYYLGEALRKGVIELDVFLKQVRELSRKQFMLRALMTKCRSKAGLH